MSEPSAATPCPGEEPERYHRAMLHLSAGELADLYAVDAVHEFPFLPARAGRSEPDHRRGGRKDDGKVLMEITMSLDGYLTGPEVSPHEPMCRGGEALHEWMFAGNSAEEVNRRCVDYDPGR